MKKRQFILIGVFLFFLLLVIGGVVFIQSMTKGIEELIELEIDDIDLSMVEDGEYNGTYQQLPVSVEVIVTVSNHDITDIEITKHFNGQGNDAETIIETVILEDSITIDSVAGATVSSKCILLAIKDALTP
ncbi:MAG: hypothetical protein CVV56_06780 [Tenericutes bacterium HGW-Tenericutes-1]|jgi:uncharacterized protein with FMN-binding domain|nr:MAG: hypothetical protein CVV56_06780 [Tenericutes bacterium HGW-Tenericutes-1]